MVNYLPRFVFLIYVHLQIFVRNRLELRGGTVQLHRSISEVRASHLACSCVTNVPCLGLRDLTPQLLLFQLNFLAFSFEMPRCNITLTWLHGGYSSQSVDF